MAQSGGAADAAACPMCGGEMAEFDRDPVRALLRCRGCGCRERRSAEGVSLAVVRSVIYAEANLTQRRRLEGSARIRWQMGKRRRALLRCGEVRSVCEVGPGTGDFAAAVLDDVESLTLVEESHEFVDHLRKRFEGRPVTVLRGDFMAVDLPGQYDAVAAFHVIEHTEDPGAFLRKCLGLVRPGGAVLIETPSASSLWARAFGARWGMTAILDHRFLPTADSLRALALREGAELLHVETLEPWWSLTGCAQFAMLDLWKDLRFGHDAWRRRRLERLLEQPRTFGVIRHQALKGLIDVVADAGRWLSLPRRLVMEGVGLGTDLLAVVAKK